MTITKHSILIKELEDSYVVSGSINSLEGLKISLDKPLLIDGNLTANDLILSNTDIHCIGTITCDEIDSKKNIKTGGIKSEMISCENIHVVTKGSIISLVCKDAVFLGKVNIYENINANSITVTGEMISSNIVANNMSISGKIFANGMFNVERVLINDEENKFLESSNNGKETTTLFNNSEFVYSHDKKKFI